MTRKREIIEAEILKDPNRSPSLIVEKLTEVYPIPIDPKTVRRAYDDLLAAGKITALATGEIPKLIGKDGKLRPRRQIQSKQRSVCPQGTMQCSDSLVDQLGAFRLVSCLSPTMTDRPSLTYEWQGVTRKWRWSIANMQQLHDAWLVRAGGGIPRIKQYVEEGQRK